MLSLMPGPCDLYKHYIKAECLNLPHHSSTPILLPQCITGREDDDHRLMTDMEEGRSVKLNCAGAYPTCCIELSLDGLAVNSVLQSHHINDYEGAAGTSTSFDWAPQASLEELIEGTGNALSVYDEAALCSASFKILRQIVHAWLIDVKQRGNFHADKQLQHFYRSVWE